MFTLTAASMQLGVPRRTLEAHAEKGKLATVQHVVGGRRYVLPADLEAYKAAYVDPVRRPKGSAQ